MDQVPSIVFKPNLEETWSHVFFFYRPGLYARGRDREVKAAGLWYISLNVLERGLS